MQIIKNTYSEKQSNNILRLFRIPLNALISFENPIKYHWLMLNSPSEKLLPQVKLWTKFVPAEKSAVEPPINSPVEGYGMMLLQLAENQNNVKDIYNQAVFLGNYNPNYMRVEQDIITKLSDSKSIPIDEQILSKILRDYLNLKKPVLEPWQHRLMHSYRYLRQQARSNVFANMASYLWDGYLIRLMMSITKLEEGPKPENMPDAPQIKGTLMKFDRIMLWKQAGSWKYSELVSLCKLGIPRELRPSIWSELFGLSKCKDDTDEEAKTAKYFYYVEKSRNQDSLLYQQMEQDILEVTLPSNASESDSLLLHSERIGVLKIVKAYYAWCLDENSNQTSTKKSSYGYFKGILHIIQKILQIFEESETFWCIIGFAKSLPYFFEVKDVMKGSIALGHKKLMIMLSTLVECRYKDLYNAIMKYGLPIEYYLSDKLSTMLSTVFSTETLMRIYDLVALEAASGSQTRSMWVIMTGCILLLQLNEVYIKSARSAEEIELIINNTGINCLSTQKIIEKTYELSNELFSFYNPELEAFLFVVAKRANSAVGSEYTWTKKFRELDVQYEKVKQFNKKVDELINKIRLIGQEEVKDNEKKNDGSEWIKTLVNRFCSFYNGFMCKEVGNTISIYISKVFNVEFDYILLRVKYGELTEEFSIKEDGTIDKGCTIQLAGLDANVYILVGGKYEYVIDLREIPTDTPLALEKPLISGEENILAKLTMPQPFVSFAVLLATKKSESVDLAFQSLKKSLMVKSQIILPKVKEEKEALESVLISKKRENILYNEAGLITPMEEEKAENIETEKEILRHLFSLLQKDSNPDNNPELNALIDETYQMFVANNWKKIPLRRFMISLIAASELIVEEKAGLIYSLFASMSGCGYPFLLADLIELVQLLYELHLIPIAPNTIQSIVEQVFTDEGINRITNVYLIGPSANISEELQKIHMYFYNFHILLGKEENWTLT